MGRVVFCIQPFAATCDCPKVSGCLLSHGWSGSPILYLPFCMYLDFIRYILGTPLSLMTKLYFSCNNIPISCDPYQTQSTHVQYDDDIQHAFDIFICQFHADSHSPTTRPQGLWFAEAAKTDWITTTCFWSKKSIRKALTMVQTLNPCAFFDLCEQNVVSPPVDSSLLLQHLQKTREQKLHIQTQDNAQCYSRAFRLDTEQAMCLKCLLLI